jgi:Na+/glutamate symporter
MQRGDIAAAAIHGIPTLGLLLQGLLYLTTSRYMPYHGDAIGVAWEALSAQHRAFLLGVIKGMGAGSTAVSLALLVIIAIPLRRGEAWARWAVPLVGAAFTALIAYAAYTIDIGTPASTPWRQTLGLTGLYAIGGLVSWRWAK